MSVQHLLVVLLRIMLQSTPMVVEGRHLIYPAHPQLQCAKNSTAQVNNDGWFDFINNFPGQAIPCLCFFFFFFFFFLLLFYYFLRLPQMDFFFKFSFTSLSRLFQLMRRANQ